jgi:uncharacterized protein YjiS (DUF1127 family)
MTHAALTAIETMGLPVRSPFARIAATIKAARARQAERRTYAYLLDAEQYLLDDIGLTRAEVKRALMACDGR